MRVLPALLLCLAAAPQDAVENPIDAYFSKLHAEEKRSAASEAGDHEFFRRITIDLLGRLPLPDEARAYAADKAADKRSKLVERLVRSEESAEFLADLWLDILVDHDVTQQDFARSDLGPFRLWLKTKFHEDMPWPDMARAMLGDRGARREKPAVNFALKHLGAEDVPVKLAVVSARIFSNRDIRCAQCHDHPFETMTQEEFWGYVEFFRPLRNRGALVEGAVAYREKREDIGELQGIAPKFLDGRLPEEGLRRGEALAEMTVNSKDRACAKAFIDRMWRHFFGRRLVNAKGRGHAALLDGLATAFDKSGGSVRSLLRTILTSKAYQATSAGRQEDRDAYAAGPLKLMGAVQFINVFTDVFNLHDMHKEMYRKVAESDVAGAQFKDPQVMRIMFFRWSQELLLPRGRDPEEAVATGTVRMAMKFMNNKRTTGMMVSSWGLLQKLIQKRSGPVGRVEEMFYALLGRPPSAEESRELVGYINSRKTVVVGDYSAYEDVFWMLLNSSEFMFNH